MKQITLAALVFFSTTFLSGQSVSDDVGKANGFYRKGEYQKALALYHTLLPINAANQNLLLYNIGEGVIIDLGTIRRQ